MKNILIASLVFIFGLTVAKANQESDKDVKKIIIQHSLSSYEGNCPCPENVDSAGNSCGGRSAYSRSGGYSPLCYEKDVTQEMVQQYHDNLKKIVQPTTPVAPVSPSVENSTPKQEAIVVNPAPVAAEQSINSDEQSQSDGSILSQERTRFGIGIYHNGGNMVTFDNVAVTTGGNTGYVTAEVGSESAMGFQIFVQKMPKYHWGFIGSANFDEQREINYLTARGPGGTSTATYTGNKPKLSLLTLDGNLSYRWENFYIPFGINISSANLINSTGSTESWFVSGGVGAQVGIGCFASDDFAIELWSKVTNINATAYSGTTSINFGDGFIYGGVLNVKILF